MKTISLTQGKFTIVDDEDFDELNKFKWMAHKERGNWYACRIERVNKKYNIVRMHRTLMGDPVGVLIDHKDGNGLNNSKSNLRIATNQQNLMNQKAQENRKSKYKGVSLFKHCKTFRAYITYDRKQMHLGCYKTETEAALAYDNAAKRMFGEFARLNFPLE
jgi:hypothetical protein